MELKNMNYHNVTLSSGICQSQVQDIVSYLLQLNEDRLLNRFRKGANRSAPGETYYGWYGQGATTFGQWIGAMAKLYSATGDKRLQLKMVRLLDEWAQCLLPNGYTDFSEENSSTYGFEKMAGGLVDAYEYGGYAPAMDLLETITRWAQQQFDKTITREYTTYAYLAQRAMHEWYTLGENYYRAYRLTGREIFLQFGQEWDYTKFWLDMARKNDALPPLHAYSHVNSLCGAAARYQLTGDKENLDTIINGYNLLTEKHLFATGGYGPSEALFGKPGYLGASLFSPRERNLRGEHAFMDLEGFDNCDDIWGSCEVSCCAWAVFKLTNYLLCLTGEAHFAQWAEQLLINGTLAQLPLECNGRVEYYANYFCCGGRKDWEDRRIGADGNANVWQCCTGTFPQDVAAYHELIFYHGEKTLCIAQYIPSVGRFLVGNEPVELQIDGAFPIGQQYTITVHTARPTAFMLKLRIPAWAENTQVQINGMPITEKPVPDQWLQLEQLWQDGDRICLTFTYRLVWKAVDKEHPHLMALCWGPIVLAADEMAQLQGDTAHPERWIKPCHEKDGHFETEPGHDRAFPTRTHHFRPFYSFDERSWYYMYMEVIPE